MQRNRLLAGAVAVLVVAAGLAAWLVLRPAGGVPAGAAAVRPTAAPPLAGPTLAGGRLDLADLRGSVVVVNVWAAWCAPCRQELPVLVHTMSALRSRGVRLVGIDVRDGERQARDLLARIGGDPAASLTDPEGRLAAAWQVRGVPETFVVDARGAIRARHVGAVTAGWLDAAVRPLLRRGVPGG